jgi:hypothetical protein
MGDTIEMSRRFAHSPLILSRPENSRLEAGGWTLCVEAPFIRY